MTPTPPRSEAELTVMQLEAVQAWNRARRLAEEAAQLPTVSREARMDVSRRLEVLREQHRAIVQRTQEHLAGSVHVLAQRVPPRAVIVHRNAWFVGKLAGELDRKGIAVVAVPGNGAEGIGVVVAEQPDVLIVEDTLPMVPGEQVVRDACRFAPATLVVAQVAYEDRVCALRDAGAHVVHTRRVPPVDVVDDLVSRLGEGSLVDA